MVCFPQPLAAAEIVFTPLVQAGHDVDVIAPQQRRHEIRAVTTSRQQNVARAKPLQEFAKECRLAGLFARIDLFDDRALRGCIRDPYL